jgi:pimeloyl-ACP methyl ester carboxylesterase
MMRTLTRNLFICLCALASTCALAAPAAAFDRAVTFTVANVNRSAVPCTTGSGTVEIRGHLVGPDPVPSAVTLYLHGLGFDNLFWRFRAVSGLDYAAELASAGHASVIIDRLGYGASTKPANGTTGSCLGAQADIAHQIIEQLRSGGYTIESGPPPRFDRVALAGHSVGGSIAQIEAYSFGDIDGLIIMAWADQGFSADIELAFDQSAVDCALGSNGYSFIGKTEADFDHLFFNTPRPIIGKLPLDKNPTADAAVITAANGIRQKDPCGDKNSIPAELALANVKLGTIKVPTLLACGGDDAIFPQPACEVQRLRFTGVSDLSLVSTGRTGHAVTLGFTAPEYRSMVEAWLTQHQF